MLEILNENTRTTTIGISRTFCPGCNCEVISGHCGLQVIFVKKDGCPNFRARAKESLTFSEHHRRDPVK